MATRTVSAKRSPATDGDPGELLSRAMVAWARRDIEPAELVEKALDDLHRAWAAGLLDADRPTLCPNPRRRDTHHSGIARSVKAVEDGLRERYIVTRYAALVRRGRRPKDAREIVAADIREGLHLPAMRRVEIDYRPAAYHATYSEKSVARVLKKFDAAR